MLFTLYQGVPQGSLVVTVPMNAIAIQHVILCLDFVPLCVQKDGMDLIVKADVIYS